MAKAKKKTAPKKSPTNKKPRSRRATTRSTAGPGYQFEDLVAAWLMVKMLRGEVIPGIDVSGNKLQMQTSSLGWEIDDLLVYGVPSIDGEVARLAISCKSNVQVTAAGLPATFVTAAWKQWREPAPMDHSRDVIALVPRDRHTAFASAWADIKSWCADSDIDFALAKINQTNNHRRVFESAREPTSKPRSPASDGETVSFIRALEVIPVDFQLQPSLTEQDAIAQCRAVVASGKLTDARALWQALVMRAESARLSGGTITLEELWAELRSKFALAEHPDFAASSRVLANISSDYIGTIETRLPNGASFPRKRLTDDLGSMVNAASFTFVYGNSGTGKSALVKTALESNFPDRRQVWLGPEQAEAALNELKRSSVGLDQPLLNVLANTTNQQNVLVIDSAERLTPDGRARVKALLIALAAGSAGPSWRVVIVGQIEAWVDGRLRQLLDGAQSAKDMEVQELNASEVIAALRSTVWLRWLGSHNDAVAALTNMRALAWVIQAETAFRSEPAGAMSLTAVADRLWGFWTDDKAAVQNLLMRLAEREANFERSFALSQMNMGVCRCHCGRA